MKETIYKYPTPLRIALLTDLHDKPFGQIIHLLKLHQPDIICISGDVVYRPKPSKYRLDLAKTKYVLPFLQACAKIAPSFMSLGNHECMLLDQDFSTISKTGITILNNRWCDYNGILIGGLSSADISAYRNYHKNMPSHYPYWYKSCSRQPDLTWLDSFLKPNKYRILLCHHPEYRDKYLKNMPIDMILSGHAHGGQIRLLGHGLFAPGQGLFPKYTNGIHGNMIISTGLSNTAGLIPRLFNPTEILYVEPS